MNYKDIQKEEARTWLIDDPVIRKEKAMREWIRYPLLKKQMGLDYLDTSDMVVYDIGCGPLGGVSSVLNAKRIVRFDPLISKYEKYFPQVGAYTRNAEDIKEELNQADLIIVTNAMDHFEFPEVFLLNIVKHMKPGAYFTHFHAINNAISHPHPAHEHNVNPELLHRFLDKDFETCWYMDFQHDALTYGWMKQPAFCGLYRKVTGYGDRK